MQVALQRKNTKCVPIARITLIFFHEQAVYGMMQNGKKLTLEGNIAMWLYHLCGFGR